MAVRIAWEDQAGNTHFATISSFTWGHIRAPQHSKAVFFLDTEDGQTLTVRPCEMSDPREAPRD